MLLDFRYAIRTLLRSPAFTAIAVLTLALGIGANTAIFSLVNTLILKPLPFRDPARLIAAWDTYQPQFPKLGISPAELDLWQQQSDLFEQSAWYRYVSKDLDLSTPGAEALEVHAAIISTNLFPLLGVAPAQGRAFSADEPPDSVLLSDRLYHTYFAANPDVIGKPVRLNGQNMIVLGVMPTAARFPDWADLWIPPGPLLADELTNPVRHSLGFVARLRPGVSELQAAARLEALSHRLAAEHPKTSTGFGMRVATLQSDLTAPVRPALLMLMGAVALVLLIACGNVANLLLARASARRKEIAIRIALGAGAFRIARQLLTESIVLSVIGGAIGLAIGQAALTLLSPIQTPLDASLLLFLTAISLSTGILFGLAPALQALRNDHNAVIKSGAGRVRSALVVAEVALAMVLVAGAGLLIKSFLHLMHVDPGFQPSGLLTLRISFPPSRKPDALFESLRDKIQQLPGVDGFATANALPLIANRANTSRFNVPGSPLINPDALPAAQLRIVSPDYFRVMGIPLRAGRAFTDRDLTGSSVIINESMARRFWPGQDAVGQKFVTGVWGPTPTYSTIVGIVADVKQFGLDSEPTLDEYFPAQFPQYVIVHTAGNPSALASAVRAAIDPDLPVSDLRTMDQVLAESAQSRRWTMMLLASFAALALLLALVGIYGVISWSVAQRTREIGIRVALGARSDEVVSMILRYGMKLCAMGLVLGIAAAFALRQTLASLLFDVSTTDPAIYAAVALLMLFVAALACYIPARRASRVDPLIALRYD